MARIVKIAKYVRVPAPDEFLRPPARRAPATPPALFLLQLRAVSRPQFIARRLTISITAPANPNARPVPVKITHA
jgi:hypothetical protein